MILKIARHVKNKNQYDLSRETCIPQSKISLFENGYLSPNDQEKTAIAKALSVGVDEIDWCRSGKQ
ncbi:MAG: helix-turn-helix transcriptional regulator [Desulfobacteraceae bacterium]|nr:helix-turn-helix transcriptional regulator [Desulfobacteraceae bacterium]MBU4002830.1 helix-turn-helix domain-containing protein [Pseudomonadota bacterium]